MPVGPLVSSALCQTTCLLIPSKLLRQNRPPLYSELLQRLLRTGCHLAAGRLCTPDEKQRRHVSEILRPSAGEALLREGPCLIIALQADNAVTCFNIILERYKPSCNGSKRLQQSIVQSICNCICLLLQNLQGETGPKESYNETSLPKLYQ